MKELPGELQAERTPQAVEGRHGAGGLLGQGRGGERGQRMAVGEGAGVEAADARRDLLGGLGEEAVVGARRLEGGVEGAPHQLAVEVGFRRADRLLQDPPDLGRDDRTPGMGLHAGGMGEQHLQHALVPHPRRVRLQQRCDEGLVGLVDERQGERPRLRPELAHIVEVRVGDAGEEEQRLRHLLAARIVADVGQGQGHRALDDRIGRKGRPHPQAAQDRVGPEDLGQRHVERAVHDCGHVRRGVAPHPADLLVDEGDQPLLDEAAAQRAEGGAGRDHRQHAVGLAAEADRRQGATAADMVDPVPAHRVEGGAVEPRVAVRPAGRGQVLDRVAPGRRPERGVEGGRAVLLGVEAAGEGGEPRRVEAERLGEDVGVCARRCRRGGERGGPGLGAAAPVGAGGVGVVGRRSLGEELRPVGEAMRPHQPVEPGGAGRGVERGAHPIDQEPPDRRARDRQGEGHGHADALGLGIVDEPAQRGVDRRQVVVVERQRGELVPVGQADGQLVGDRGARDGQRRRAVLLDADMEPVGKRAGDGGPAAARRRVGIVGGRAGTRGEVLRAERLGDPGRAPGSRSRRQRRPGRGRVAGRPDRIPVGDAGGALGLGQALVERLGVERVGKDPHPEAGAVGGRAALDPHRQQHQRRVALQRQVGGEQAGEGAAQRLLQVAERPRPGRAALGERADPGVEGRDRRRVGGRPHGRALRPRGGEVPRRGGELARQPVAGRGGLGDGPAGLGKVRHQPVAPATMRVARKAARAGSWNSR